MKAGGFLTIKTDAVFPDGSSLHLVRVDQDECPSEENLISCNLLGEAAQCAERFDALGCAAINESRDVDVFVMDELGPRELEAHKFTARVMQMLDSDIPVIGVLQKVDSPFLTQVANHPDVQVIQVTRENRENVLRQLLQCKL